MKILVLSNRFTESTELVHTHSLLIPSIVVNFTINSHYYTSRHRTLKGGPGPILLTYIQVRMSFNTTVKHTKGVVY